MYVFCFLSSLPLLSPATTRQCLSPTVLHVISLLSLTNCVSPVRASIINNMMGEVSWVSCVVDCRRMNYEIHKLMSSLRDKFPDKSSTSVQFFVIKV